jgi:hypothetical protein
LQNTLTDNMKRNPRATGKGDRMGYGGNSQDEMEVTIRLDREDRQAHICSTWPEWSRKLERLSGSPKQVTERDGKATSVFWVGPPTAIRGRRPASP